MPTNQEKAEVFKALVENGLAFIERAASELPKEPTFSIAHFATGLELLLKARLFAEHWTLIATNPQGSPWSAITSGDAHTLQASDLCAAVTSTTGTSLNHEKDVFEKVFRHRNRVLHFVPPADLTEVEAEQCRAWYRLHHLLSVRWEDVFVHKIISLEPNPRNHALLRFLYCTGARVSEVVGLTGRDLQPRDTGGQASIFGKGGKTRAVLLPAALWSDVKALRYDSDDDNAPVFRSRRGGPLVPSSVHRIVRAAARRAGVTEPVSAHWFRHAHASHALDRGAPIHLVQHTLGHASVTTTGRYLHARPTDSSSTYLAV